MVLWRKNCQSTAGVDYFNSITNFRHNITQSGEYFQQQNKGQELRVTNLTDPFYNFDKRGAGVPDWEFDWRAKQDNDQMWVG